MPEIPQLERLSREFYQGKYREVKSLLGASPLPLKETDFERKTGFQIGSLVFLGEVTEARILYERAVQNTPTDPAFHVRARFFLGVGLVRRSDYKGAARYFAENLIEARKTKNSEVNFYAAQGRAFLRFFRGQFNRSKLYAEQAFAAAFADNFIFGQVLSLDLLGHSLCQTGSIRRGLFELQRALRLAEQIGHGGLATALRISVVKYRAQFGLDLKNAIDELRQASDSLAPQDNYSRAEIDLELIRQLILRGRGSEAQKILDESSAFIYENQNRRQMAAFNLRCAHLLFLRGEFRAAWALTHTLKSNLDKVVDGATFDQAEGLAAKIKKELGRPEPTPSTLPTTSFVDQRIRGRWQGLKPANKGEDPIGDFIDRVHNQDFACFYELQSLGLWGLLPPLLKIPIGASALHLGPSRGEFVIVEGSDVTCVPKGLTEPMRKLILKLRGRNFRSKQELVEAVWNYQYDPSIHDALLHATIAKLRKLLGANAVWVEWSNEGYKLANHILVLAPEAQPIVNPVSRPEQRGHDLNIRQIKWVSSLKPEQYFSVRQYAKKFKVCTMTACRDLTGLHRQGKVLRVGKGRATVYGLP